MRSVRRILLEMLFRRSAPPSPTKGIWKRLETSLQGLHKAAELFPPVRSAVDSLLSCLELIQTASSNQQEIEELTSELTSLVELLTQHMDSSKDAHMTGSIAYLACGIEEQAKLIESKGGRGVGQYLLKAKIDQDELSRCYRRIGSLFRQLQVDASLSVWKTLSHQVECTQLEGLSPIKLADYNSSLSTCISRRTCADGTRTSILSELTGWSRDLCGADLYWMNGMAGTGKTTIACTFSESLEARNQLAGSFFCTRTAPECRDAKCIIPTIAYQLAHYSIPFRSALCETLHKCASPEAKNISTQFDRLLKEPLLKVKGAIPTGLVVVIDALDECEDTLEVELLLSVVLKFAVEVPLKFFVTSRPEPGIYHRMLARGQGCRTVMHLHEVEKSLVQADIELYLKAELGFMAPTVPQIKELARRSGCLFIYAATLVRYIKTRRAQTDPQRRFQSVLSMTSETVKQYSAIDALYATVLKSAFEDEELEANEIENIRRVLQAVICAQEPISVPTLATLAGLDEEQARAALCPLRAVIHLSDNSGMVSTLHASFPDFIFEQGRSGSFYCEPAVCNGLIARRCFETMESRLRFNICNLDSSFLLDSEVEDLAGRVNRAVSPVLLYACRYWGHHLKFSSYSDYLCSVLGAFLSNHLLFWMEVLNLKREIILGADIMQKANQWLQIGAAPVDVTKLAEDARKFVTDYAVNPISQSTPHIYVSLLPFCPRSSAVFKKYMGRTKGLMNVAGSAMHARESPALSLWRSSLSVWSVAYSPDGTSVTVGCMDGTISIRSAHDGTLVTEPFKAHSLSVKSVAYSPDGTFIASGSADRTIRVWGAHDGTQIAGPFEGYTGTVNSVAYSPNTTQIVSGSSDGTIRVWIVRDDNGRPVNHPLGGYVNWIQSVAMNHTLDASGANNDPVRQWDNHDGNEPFSSSGPFQERANSVNSVAYSPDGAYVVSGSSDSTIRVWDARNGTLITTPFRGHTGPVRSVVYSPDGTRIASGSNDTTIRVWNARDGTPIAGPFHGHTGGVFSVGYSPDGTYLSSGSADCTIRLWDANSATPIAGPFQGHTGVVHSVMYSPDGTCVISGAYDMTIRVWSAQEGSHMPVARPLEGHSPNISSVVFSPDGSRIISCSWDTTIQVWDALDGTPITGPLRGHTDWVLPVSYSPNGTRVASGSWDNTIILWNVDDGEQVAGPFRGHAGKVTSVAYSPSGALIVSGSRDKTVLVWDAYNGTIISGPFRGHTNWVLSVAFSPDNNYVVSGSFDRTVRVWNTRNGTPAEGLIEGHTNSVSSVVYSPNGAHIASGSWDSTIRIWSAHNCTLVLGPITGHTGSIRSVAYSPNGTHIVSGADDNTVRVWNAHDGAPFAGPFGGHVGPIRSVTYSPDSMYVVSGSDDTTIRVWSTKHNQLMTSEPDGCLELGCRCSDDGWVLSAKSRRLFWVPFALRFAYLSPTTRCRLIIDAKYGSLSIEYGDLLFGERWAECYKS